MKPVISARPIRLLRTLVKVGLLFIVAGLLAASASADPIDVTYTVSGSSGDWILDFSVTNNLNAGQDVYIFGVLLPTTDILASPSQWVNPATFNPDVDGGPNVTFNNIWHLPVSTVGYTNAIAAGNTLSGFEAVDTSAAPPSFVEWYAYSADSTSGGTAPYTGGGNFNAGFILEGFASPEENPGFIGTATPTPEPSLLLMFGAGLLGLPFLRRRQRG